MSRDLQIKYAMRFLFRLDLNLHADAEFFFGILNFATKQRGRFVYPTPVGTQGARCTVHVDYASPHLILSALVCLLERLENKERC